MCTCQQAQADPAVVLAAVQLVEAADMVAEAAGSRVDQRSQPEAEQEAKCAVWGAFLQEAQPAAQRTAQRILTQ